MKLPKITISPKLKSRKLWLSLIAAVFPILNETFEWGFDEQVVMKVVAALLSFVFVEGAADAVGRLNSK